MSGLFAVETTLVREYMPGSKGGCVAGVMNGPGSYRHRYRNGLLRPQRSKKWSAEPINAWRRPIFKAMPPSSEKVALSDAIKDELHGQRREQDAGNTSDDIRARHAEHAPERLDQDQRGIGEGQGK